MHLEYFHYQLNLKSPFRLSVGVRDHTDIVIVKLSYEHHVGYGEASLPPYFDENISTVKLFLEKIDVSRLKVDLPINEILQYVDGIDKDNNAAKAAIDIALHDLKGKIEKKSIYELYGLERPIDISTSLTFGISSLPELEKKLIDAEGVDLIKLKLGGNNDKALIQDYLSICQKPFCVDVNQGWNDKEEALELVNWLHEKGAIFVEQPLKKEKWKEMEWLFKRSPLPLIADESVKRTEDVNKVIGCFHGINIKLMKSAGIYEAIQMIKQAKELELKILIGCMAESSCAVAAAWQISSLADWVDLDAPLLISNDPFIGIKYKNGEIDVVGSVGLGVIIEEGF